MNKPYVKEYNKLGQVSNPITKDKPYVNLYQNRQQRSTPYQTRPFNNRANTSKRKGVHSRDFMNN